MFPDDYLELRGIIDPNRPLQGLDEFVEKRGEGLMGVAFGTRNAEESRRLLAQNGVGVRKLMSLARNFEHQDGWTQPRFALCFPVEADVVGLMHVVLCEHLTPELLRSDEALSHDNTAVAVLGITGAVDDLDAAEEHQRRLLGDAAIVRCADGIRITLPSGQWIRLLRTERFRQEFGSAAPVNLPTRPYLGAIALKVTDLTRTEAVLKNSAVDYALVEPGQRLRVAASQACGSVLDFVAS